MALRGTDVQLMVNRAVDISAEQMKNAKLHETSQHHLAAQNRLQAREEQSRTQGVLKAEKLTIADDEEREPAGGEQKKKEQEAKQASKEVLGPELSLPAGRREHHRIDIQV